MHKVFVYGTLKRGYWNNHLLQSSQFIGSAVVRGALYSLGGIPGMKEHDHDGNTYDVMGEVWIVNDATLTRLDHLEGYTPERHDEDIHTYRRQNVTDVVTGDTYHAYFYQRGVDRNRIITNGNWEGTNYDY